MEELYETDECLESLSLDLTPYALTNKQKLLDELNHLVAFFQDTSFTEYDLTSLRKAQTAVRKKQAELKAKAKEYCQALTQQISDDTDEVQDALKDVLSSIQAQFNKIENDYRSEKQAKLIEKFNEFETAVEYDQIFDSRWLNHTVSMAQAESELEFRVQLVNEFWQDRTDDEKERVLSILRRYQYKPTKVFDMKKAVEKEFSKEEEVLDMVEMVTIYVEKPSLMKVIQLLKENDIWYEL